MESSLRTDCEYCWLGRVEYSRAWDLQNRLAAEIAAGRRGSILLLLEHPHTYTLGRRTKVEHLLWDQAELTARGITVHPTDRGGDVTYHGPGQLVGYPLISLGAPDAASGHLPQADYVGYLRRLEETLIAALARFGITAYRRTGLTGVWVGSEGLAAKIASIGVKVDGKGISRHGFALNIQTDEQYWMGIIPCGLEGVRMISLADLLEGPPAVADAAQVVAGAFGTVFDFEMRPLDPVSLLG